MFLYKSVLALGASIFLQEVGACHYDLASYQPPNYEELIAASLSAREERNSRFARQSSNKFAITNVHVFDGQTFLPPAMVVVDGGVITSDHTYAEEIDGQGGFLIPGLIDSHCHPTNSSHLEQLTSNGVTTAYNMACYSSKACQHLQNHTGLVDMKTSTAPAAAPGSQHGNIATANDPAAVSVLLSNVSQVPDWLMNQTSWNPDVVKAIGETPGLNQDILNAVAQGSRKLNKQSVIHAAQYSAYVQAIIANFSQVHHTPLDQLPEASYFEQMKRQGQVSTPTLAIMKAIADKTGPTNYTIPPQVVRSLQAAGISISAGTDANESPGIPVSVPFGTSIHQELELLVEAGMTPVEALRAATINAVSHYGLDDRGVIAPGQRADLVLLGSNPLLNISNTRDIKGIWVAGIQYTDAIAAMANASIPSSNSTPSAATPGIGSSSQTVAPAPASTGGTVSHFAVTSLATIILVVGIISLT